MLLFRHFLSLCSLALLLGATESASAQFRGKVRCPRIIADVSTGTFETRANKMCFRSKGAARRAGLIAANAGGDPASQGTNTVNNPELDIERVFTGLGSFRLERAFRVTNTSRVVTVKVYDCKNPAGNWSLQGKFQIARVAPTFQNVTIEQTGAIDPEHTATVAEPGIYGVKYVDEEDCNFQIIVR